MPRTRARSSARALTEASPGLEHQGAGRVRVGVDDLPGGVQGHTHGDQPGLGPVVQVPLDPADLGRPGVQRLGAGLLSCRTRSANSACPAGASSMRASRP